MVSVENFPEFKRIYRRVCGTTKPITDKNKLYDVFACAGKTLPSEADLSEVLGEDIRDVYNAFRDMEAVTAFDGICPWEHVDIPTALVIQQLQKANMDFGEHEKVENILIDYDRDGLFDIERFAADFSSTRADVILELLTSEYHDSSSQEGSPRNEHDKGHQQVVQVEEEGEGVREEGAETEPQEETNEESNEPDIVQMHQISSRGFCLLGRDVRCIYHHFVLPTADNIKIDVVLDRNTDMDESAFRNDIFGVLYDLNQNHVEAVTGLRREREIYTTEFIDVGPGEFDFAVMCIGVSVEGQLLDTPTVGLVDSENKLTKRFKMSLMNIFEMFDVDGDGMLNKSEFDVFNAATGDAKLDDQDWQVLVEHFGVQNDCVPMSAFLQMHQIEADTCKEEANGDFSDMWASLHLIGYDGDLRLKMAFPYTITVYSPVELSMSREYKSVSVEQRDQITDFLFIAGNSVGIPSLPLSLFKGEHYGVLTAKANPGTAEDVSYKLQVTITEGTQVKVLTDIDDFRPAQHTGLVLLMFFISEDTNWNATFTLQLN